MRILFLTSRLPYPPNRGDRLRAFNFIKSLHRQHEIHLISFISSDEELQYIPELKQYCKEITYIKKRSLQSLLSVLSNFWKEEPLQSLYYKSSQMEALIDHSISTSNFSVIYIHLFRMAQFVIKHSDQYRILDLTDVISTEIKRSVPYRNFLWRLLFSIEAPRISRYEIKMANIFEETWLISPADYRTLKSQLSKTNIKTITNGIDSQVYYPLDVKSVPFRLIFTGHMGIPHNIDAARFFALNIFPDVRKLFPESIFIIAGAEPARSVLELSSKPNIKVLGYVEDLNNQLNQSQIFVAPLRFSAGIQNKVLEAMAAGIPVVTSQIVNEGINARDGEEIIIADSPEDFVRQISKLFRDEDLRTRIGSSGEKFVREKFSWDIVLQHINNLEERLSNHSG